MARIYMVFSNSECSLPTLLFAGVEETQAKQKLKSFLNHHSGLSLKYVDYDVLEDVFKNDSIEARIQKLEVEIKQFWQMALKNYSAPHTCISDMSVTFAARKFGNDPNKLKLRFQWSYNDDVTLDSGEIVEALAFWVKVAKNKVGANDIPVLLRFAKDDDEITDVEV